METVSVIIATFGDRIQWNARAKRALQSVLDQTKQPDELIRIHGHDLCRARNSAAMAASSTWLCFLDADDELGIEYLEGMICGAAGDLRYPMVKTDSMEEPNDLFTGKSLLEGNYMAIGTLVKRKRFLDVGGFPQYPAYEDWALWLRCMALGDRARLVPQSVYIAHTTPAGRNAVNRSSDLALQILDDFKKWKSRYATNL